VNGAGHLYGTTYRNQGNYKGLLFSLVQMSLQNWQEVVLHPFGNGSDGYGASGKVIFDFVGNIYGTTYSGGVAGLGTVFKISRNQEPSGANETILYNFLGGNDARNPYAGLVFDSAGNLYGTTEQGGPSGYGTVFKLEQRADGSWSESVLYAFTGHRDGGTPDAGLAFDHAGNLYGTTISGGSASRGTVFKLTPSGLGQWTETVLHSFTGSDGIYPYNLGSLVVDSAGNIFGTTVDGGQYSEGVAFEITP
jgi:uncharacterized repeat protein (TIGR03803 family)